MTGQWAWANGAQERHLKNLIPTLYITVFSDLIALETNKTTNNFKAASEAQRGLLGVLNESLGRTQPKTKKIARKWF
jgi:hypothetical protein